MQLSKIVNSNHVWPLLSFSPYFCGLTAFDLKNQQFSTPAAGFKHFAF